MWEHRRLNEDGWSVAADGTGLQGGMNGAMTRESGGAAGCAHRLCNSGEGRGQDGRTGQTRRDVGCFLEAVCDVRGREEQGWRGGSGSD